MNKAYLSYVEYLKSIKFEQKLEKLKKKYEGKRILLFKTGAFLNAILDNYDIKSYLNIIGISDKKFETKLPMEYKGFNAYTPNAMRNLGLDVILTINKTSAKKIFKTHHLFKKNIIIENIIQYSFNETLNKFSNKLTAIFNFLKTSKNLFTTALYSIRCTADELNTKIGHIKKINSLKDGSKIRTMFICEDTKNTDFINIYNILKEDFNFKVLPIILMPKRLLEQDKIDEEDILKHLKFFNQFSYETIDAAERTTDEAPCIQAFKPDLIFYQHPIYIKDSYKVTNALTFSIPYDYDNIDTKLWSSWSCRKKVSNLWKMFVIKNENNYKKYTKTQLKNIITPTPSTASIVKSLKHLLKRD